MTDENMTPDNQPDIIITLEELDAISSFMTQPAPPPLNLTALVETQCINTSRKYYLLFEQVGPDNWTVRGTLDDNVPPQGTTGSGNVSVKKDLVSGNIDWSAMVEGNASCPYCGHKDVILCGTCGHLSCQDGGNAFRCAWCGVTGTVEGQIQSLHGSAGKKKK